MKVACVVPTCRGFKIPKQTVDCFWYIVHDRQEWPIEGEANHIVAPDKTMYGERCSSIRSAGFLAAYRDGADYILTLDDDCSVPTDWVEQHLEGLTAKIHPWEPTVPGLHCRGVPYHAELQTVAVTHGLWDGIQDIDGETQKRWEDNNYKMYHRQMSSGWNVIHPPFMLCSMNFGFAREVAPVMYQWAQGPDFAFHRFDDVWLSIACQRVLSMFDYSFLNGWAIVYHQKASDTLKNIEAERAGKEVHEAFWKYVWSFNIKMANITNTYLKLADHIEKFKTGIAERDVYFQLIARNMRAWIEALNV